MSTGTRQASEDLENDADVQVMFSDSLADSAGESAARLELHNCPANRIHRRRRIHRPSQLLSALERLSLLNCIGRLQHYPNKSFDPEKTACMYCAFLLLWLFLGFGICTFVFTTLYFGQNQDRYHRLRATCKLRAEHLSSEFTTAIAEVQGMNDVVSSFYLSDPDFIAKGASYQEQFQNFWDKSMDTPLPLVTSFGWMAAITKNERGIFDKRFFVPLTDFVTGGPVQARETYYPLMLADRLINRKLGADVYTFPGYKQWLMAARKTGKVTMSYPVPPLLEAGDLGINIRLLVPTYRTPPPQNASSQVLNNLTVGYISAHFQTAKFLALVVRTSNHVLSALADVTDRSNPIAVLPGRNDTSNLGPAGLRSSYELSEPVRFEGVNRRFEIWCRHESKRPFPLRPLVMMLFALGGVLLVTEMILASHARFRDAGEEVQRMEAIAEKMREAKIAAQAADKAKGQFLAAMSHEMRTPLNGLLGMISLLSDTKMTAMQADCVQTACTSGQALLSLINDVLDLSKIEAGRMDLENITFDVRVLTDEVLSLFAEKAREKNLQIAALVQPYLPSMVTGDLNRLRQIMMNLVGNAIKYTERGHVLICVFADTGSQTPDQPYLNSNVSCNWDSPLTMQTCDLETGADGRAHSRQETPPGVFRSSFCQRLWGSARVPKRSSRYRNNAPTQRSAPAQSPEGSDVVSSLISVPPLSKPQFLELPVSLGVAETQEPSGPPTVSRNDISEITLSGFPVADQLNTWPHIASWLEVQAGLRPLTGQTLEGASNDIPAGGNTSKVSPLNLVFSIQDTGRGIQDETQNRIFEPFIQEDNTTARRFGGTGIGLSISRKLARLMGGDLTFVSRHSVGSTFTCNINLEQGHVPDGSVQEGIRKEQVTARWEREMRNSTLVLVDDNVLRSKVVETYLLQLGMRMLMARSPNQAGEILASDSNLGAANSSPLRTQAGMPGGANQVAKRKPWAVLLDWSASWITACEGCKLAIWLKLQDTIWHKNPKLPVVVLMERMDPLLKGIAERAAAEGRILTTLLKPLRRSLVVASMAKALQLDFGESSVNTLKKGVTSPASIEHLLKGRRFLVVDDNMVNRKVASKFLSKFGVEVDCVEGGAEALDRLVKEPPIDAILMDIQMPGMDGYECSQHIREMEREGKIATRPNGVQQKTGGLVCGVCTHVPIVAVTADVLKGTREKCFKSGMDGYLTKPMDPARLYEAVAHFFIPPVD